MAWVRLDDGFYQHPKILRVGPVGMALQVAALCYCNRHLTDGFVPAEAVPMLVSGGDKVVRQMLEVGLWDEAEGGYQIHDFLLYQPSRRQVLDDRAKKQAAGQAGGQASAKARGQAAASPVLREVLNPRTRTRPYEEEETQIDSSSSKSSSSKNEDSSYNNERAREATR